MNVLITGGFGFLGGRLAQELSRQPDVGLLLGSRAVRAAPTWLPHARAVQTLWQSPKQLASVLEDVDVVVHLATMNASACAADPAGSAELVRRSVANLLAAAKLSGVGRLLYVSTAHVYGALVGCIDEASRVAPAQEGYGAMHLEGERVLRDGVEDEISRIVVRLSNTFGAPVSPDVDCWSLLVNDLCRQSMAHGRLSLTSKTVQRRDFAPMADTVRALSHLVRLPDEQVGDGLFNLGSGWTPTNIEVARWVARAMGTGFGEEVELALGDLPSLASPPPLDYQTTKLRNTGFVPSGSFDEELNDLLGFCRLRFAGSTEHGQKTRSSTSR